MAGRKGDFRALAQRPKRRRIEVEAAHASGLAIGPSERWENEIPITADLFPAVGAPKEIVAIGRFNGEDPTVGVGKPCAHAMLRRHALGTPDAFAFSARVSSLFGLLAQKAKQGFADLTVARNAGIALKLVNGTPCPRPRDAVRRTGVKTQFARGCSELPRSPRVPGLRAGRHGTPTGCDDTGLRLWRLGNLEPAAASKPAQAGAASRHQWQQCDKAKLPERTSFGAVFHSRAGLASQRSGWSTRCLLEALRRPPHPGEKMRDLETP